MKVKTRISKVMLMISCSMFLFGCGKQAMVEEVDPLLPEERESIVLGKLSPEHIYYNEVVTLDPACADYIEELTIYDKEIDDTFVVHISLPP